LKAFVIPLVGSLIGLLMYLAVTAAVLIKGYKPPAPATKKPAAIVEGEPLTDESFSPKKLEDFKANPVPSWKFYSPEVDNLVEQMRLRNESLKEREEKLEALAKRIEAERAELAAVTQSVVRIREEIDRRIIRIQDDEAVNVKRLAKSYAGMEPASVAKILGELDEKLAVKILSQMKDEQNGAILDALAKTDAKGAKLAASLSDKIRLVPTAKKP
jgi:flagellar motility protein MotE (MotC chaperone)